MKYTVLCEEGCKHVFPIAKKPLRERVQAWLCQRGWHSWEGLALLEADLCPACGRQWLWAASWEYVDPQEVFGAYAGTEAPVR